MERVCVSLCHYKQQRGVKTFRHCCSAHVLATTQNPVVEMSEVESAQRHAAGLLRGRGNVLIEGDEESVCVDLPSSKLRFFYKTVLTCLLCWSLLSLACQTFERHEVWSTLQLGPEPPTTTHYSVQEGIVWLTICCVFKCHLVVVLSKIVYATIIDLHEKRVIIIMLWQTQFGQTTYNMCRHCNQSVCCSVCWLWISSLRTITCLRLKIWCH